MGTKLTRGEFLAEVVKLGRDQGATDFHIELNVAQTKVLLVGRDPKRKSWMFIHAIHATRRAPMDTPHSRRVRLRKAELEYIRLLDAELAK